MLDIVEDLHGIMGIEITAIQAGVGKEQGLGQMGLLEQQDIRAEGVKGAWKVGLIICPVWLRKVNIHQTN